MMLKKRLAVLLVALVVGGIFSLRWSYPLAREWSSGNPSAYIPIRYGSHGYGDDYFYYTFIRSLFTRIGFATDPISYEHRSEVSPHSLYTVSLWLGSLGGILTKDVRHAYYFNFLVYPAISFFLIYLLLESLTQSRWISMVLALPCLFLFSEMERTPHILITNILLSLLVYVFFRFLELDDDSWPLIAIPILIGIAPGSSPENGPITVSWSIVFACAYCRQIGTTRLMRITAASIIVALPFLWIPIHAWPLRAQFVEFGDYSTAAMSGIQFREFAADLIKLSIPLGWMLIFDFPHRKFLVTIHATMVLLFLATTPLLGSFAAHHVRFRGAELILYVTQYASLVLIGQQTIAKKGAHVRIPVIKVSRYVRCPDGIVRFFSTQSFARRMAPAAFAVFIVVYTGLQFRSHLVAARDLFQRGSDREFYELIDWATKNSSQNDVYVTLDSDLLLNLPVYSPARFYIPQAVLSTTSAGERDERLMDTLKFYGPSASRISELFPTKQSFSPSDPKLRKHLFRLVMYFFKYAEVENLAVHASTKKLQTQYVAGTDSCFHYAATHLVLSTYDRNFLGDNSPANAIQQTQSPVFANDRYSVFQIPANEWSCRPDDTKRSQSRIVSVPYSLEYEPRSRTSESCVPSSTMFPPSSTTI